MINSILYKTSSQNFTSPKKSIISNSPKVRTAKNKASKRSVGFKQQDEYDMVLNPSAKLISEHMDFLSNHLSVQFKSFSKKSLTNVHGSFENNTLLKNKRPVSLSNIYLYNAKNEKKDFISQSNTLNQTIDDNPKKLIKLRKTSEDSIHSKLLIQKPELKKMDNPIKFSDKNKPFTRKRFLDTADQETKLSNNIKTPRVLENRKPYTKQKIAQNIKNNVFSNFNNIVDTPQRFTDLSNPENINLDSSTKLDNFIIENSLNSPESSFNIQFPDKVAFKPKTMTKHNSLNIFEKTQAQKDKFHLPPKYNIKSSNQSNTIDPKYFYERHEEISRQMKKTMSEILLKKAEQRQSIIGSN